MTELSALEDVVRVIFPALGIGEYSQFHMLAIRRRLVEIAKKRMTTVNGLIVK